MQKGLVEKGREPYTPIGEPERLGEWVREQMRGEVPRWLETMLSRPEVVRNRAGRIAARGGREQREWKRRTKRVKGGYSG